MVTSCSPRPMRVVQRASNCVGCQEGWAISAGHEPRHGELFLTMAFRIVSSLRMQATKATFFVLPAASVPGAEEDGAVHVGLRHQVPAEGHGGRVGTRMDYGRQLVPDAVSSHRRHGEVSGRAGRWQQWICGLLTGMATGVSRRVISGHKSCAISLIIARRTGVRKRLLRSVLAVSGEPQAPPPMPGSRTHASRSVRARSEALPRPQARRWQ